MNELEILTSTPLLFFQITKFFYIVIGNGPRHSSLYNFVLRRLILVPQSYYFIRCCDHHIIFLDLIVKVTWLSLHSPRVHGLWPDYVHFAKYLIIFLAFEIQWQFGKNMFDDLDGKILQVIPYMQIWYILINILRR